MTPPMTPREKVAKEIVDRTGVGTLGLTYEASRTLALDIADAILTALASGSGDHAELARLADDLRKFEHHAVGSLKIDMTEVRRIIAACDAHAALLAEIAALRANEKAALKECSEWARKAGEAVGRLETSEAAGIVEGWKDRATEAERKLAEAVGHMSWMRVFVPTVWDVTEERLSEIDAFLSKEAERG